MKYLLPLAIASAIVVAGCSSDDDDDDAPMTSAPGTFQITFTNMTTGQLMTPPVVALHDASAHLFQVGEVASDAIRDIAEMGSNDALVAFAGDNPDLVSGAGVAGTGPFGPGESVTISLSTAVEDQVLSAVNMVICTNDGISGVDSVALPPASDPVLTLNAMAYDAGTRVNEADAQSFFPPPCKVGDTVEAVVEDPRVAIAAHPGQSNLANVPENSNWDFAAGAMVLQIEVTRN
ncbi:MAG: spondin domain-containing protein [Granulosicoccus sp.]|nr:spondin domain-containing protein [Granulosicoccus sp.]